MRHNTLKYLACADETLDSDELEWFVPAALLPEELQRYLNVITQFLLNPIDLKGESAASQLKRKPRKRRRRRRSPTPESAAEDGEEGEPRRKRKAKKKKEAKEYRSAQFVEDSDIDDDALQAFFEKEKALREKMALSSLESGKLATMKATGTKKRRKKDEQEGARKRKKRGDGARKKDKGSENEQDEPAAIEIDADEEKADSDADSDIFNPFASPKAGPSTARTSPSESGDGESVKVKPKPRPRPRAKAPATIEEVQSAPSEPPESPRPSSSPGPPIDISSDEDEIMVPRRTVKKKLFLSDDEDD